MVTFKDFIDYFESLAHKHTEINHNIDGKTAFFNVDIIDLIAGIKSKIQTDSFIMLLVNYNSTLNEVDPGEKEIMFFILKNQKKGNTDQNVEIRSQAETIAQEIIAKIKKDCTTLPRDQKMNEMFRGSMDKIQNVNIQHTEIMAAAQKMIGVQCTFMNKFNYCPTIREDIFREEND